MAIPTGERAKAVKAALTKYIKLHNLTKEDKMSTPTVQMAESMQALFDNLSNKLFDGDLPQAMVVLSRNNKTVGGYHADSSWINENSETIAEIGLNSNVISEADPLEIAGILIHEQIHLWQYAQGNNGRTGYHNKMFAAKCQELGLEIECLDSDATPLQKVGQSIKTTLAEDGKAMRVLTELALDEQLVFPWWTDKNLTVDDQGVPQFHPKDAKTPERKPKPAPKKKGGKRDKYTCPVCGLNAWAKPEAQLICGECNVVMIAHS